MDFEEIKEAKKGTPEMTTAETPVTEQEKEKKKWAFYREKKEMMTNFDADFGNAGEALKIYLTEGLESGDFNKVNKLMNDLHAEIDKIKLAYQKNNIENL